MKRLGLLAACLLVLKANAILFLRVSLNRAGEPEATVNLTGREVEIQGQRSPESREIPSRIQLLWNKDTTKTWFNRTKLEAIGFDCRMPADSTVAYQHWRKMRPRQTLAVLEHGGAAYEAWRRDTERKIKNLENKEKNGELSQGEKNSLSGYKRSLIHRSRLFAIDVGNDPEELRRRYPERSRFIIAPAVVRIALGSLPELKAKKGDNEKIRGEVSYLLVENLTLSGPQCARLEEMIRELEAATGRKRGEWWAAPQQIGFTICYGRNYEPWVADLRLLEEKK